MSNRTDRGYGRANVLRTRIGIALVHGARAVVIATLLGSLGGCLAAAAAGGAAAGYGVANSDRSVGQIATDARITTEVNARYVKDPDVSAVDINVDTIQGVVTLFGNVPSRAVENRALEIARGVKGVLRAESRLVIVPVAD